MGIGKRIVDLAKANLNALLDKAGGGETGIDELTDEELEAELRKRRERKQREDEERKAAERAAQNARARTTQPPPRQPPPKAPPPPRREEKKRAPPPVSSSIGEKRLRELYTQLEVPYGASFEDVKKSSPAPDAQVPPRIATPAIRRSTRRRRS